MRVGSLFAGIGGFDLAFERAGFDVAFQVEWDDAAQRVLRHRFHGEPAGRGEGAAGRRCDRRRAGDEAADVLSDRLLFSDVREVGAHNLPAVDVLVGGWPCQPVSVAGKRGASSDERDMWPEFARIAGELRPTWVVGENVPGALSAEGGRYFRRVVDDLTQLGYGVCWRTLDAQHFGVPQRRRRVFVVGCLGDLGRAAQILLEPEGRGGDLAEGTTQRAGFAGGTDEGVARALAASGQHWRGEDQDTYVASPLYSSRRGVPSAEEAAGNQLVTHTLRAEGHDASEDGTGRGTPIVTASFYSTGGSQGTGVTDEESGNVSPTLKVGSGEGIASPPAIVMRQREGKPGGGKGPLLSEDSSLTLAQANDQTVFISENQRAEVLETATGGLTRGGGKPGQGYPAVRDGMLVRRLTPTECERLQGFPDGWTEGQPDSTRYRQLGNAVAVPCVEWIARRLKAVADDLP